MFARRTTRWAFCLLLALAWALGVGAPAWAWSWPADGAVLRAFSVGADKYAAGQHRGIDVALDGASAVRAPTSGEVTFAGSVPTHGLTVTITTGDGYRASLTHLGVLRVERGDRVTEGEAVADAGLSGEAEHAEPYVHLGIRLGSDDDNYVDPLSLLPPRGAPNPPPAPAAPPAPAPQPAPAEPPVAASPSVAAPVTPAAPAAAAPPSAVAPVPAQAQTETASSQASADATGLTVVAPTGAGARAARFARPVRRGQAVSSAYETTRAGASRDVHVGGTGVPTGRSLHAASGGPGSSGRSARRPAVRPRLAEGTFLGPESSTDVARPGTSARRVRPDVGSAPEAEGTSRARHSMTSRRLFVLAAASLLACLGVGAAGLGARKVARERLPIIGARDSAGSTEKDLGRGRVAVCERPEAHRACGGIRRPLGHVRALSPPPRERRPHGQRNGRARDAGHGRGGRRGRVAA
jgi:hypothetical protein